LGARRLGHLDLEGEAALVAGIERTDADHLAVHFLAALVADAQHHGVLPGAVVAAGRCERALDVQRLDLRLVARERRLVVTQVAPARGAHAGTFEDGRLAVGAGAGRARAPRARRAHDADSDSTLALPLLPPPADFSSQPKSAWPRMRAPAATVSEPALTSPTSTPPCCSSTCCAVSMLPSSSPEMTTRRARTPPVSLAPCSMVRSPCTLTSPLNLPAMRTLPAPSILPSMVRSAAISDSLPEAWRWAGGASGAVLAAGGSRNGAGSVVNGDASFLAAVFWSKIAMSVALCAKSAMDPDPPGRSSLARHAGGLAVTVVKRMRRGSGGSGCSARARRR